MDQDRVKSLSLTARRDRFNRGVAVSLALHGVFLLVGFGGGGGGAWAWGGQGGAGRGSGRGLSADAIQVSLLEKGSAALAASAGPEISPPEAEPALPDVKPKTIAPAADLPTETKQNIAQSEAQPPRSEAASSGDRNTEADPGAGTGTGTGEGDGSGPGWGRPGSGWGLGLFGLGGLESAAVVEPSIAYCPKPSYPADARSRGLEGVVRVRMEVLADGSLGEVSVAQSSGFPDLDQAAVENLKQECRFFPARRDGVAIRRWAVQTIKFSLEDAE